MGKMLGIPGSSTLTSIGEMAEKGGALSETIGSYASKASSAASTAESFLPMLSLFPGMGKH